MSHFICLSDVVINSSEIRKIHYQKDIDRDLYIIDLIERCPNTTSRFDLDYTYDKAKVVVRKPKDYAILTNWILSKSSQMPN